jgi:hypothetical protein
MDDEVDFTNLRLGEEGTNDSTINPAVIQSGWCWRSKRPGGPSKEDGRKKPLTWFRSGR